MKKLLFLASVFAIFTSCTVDSVDAPDTQENLTYDVTAGTNLGAYKGVFTTNDSKYRATIHIDMPQKYTLADNTEGLLYPTAYLTLHTGEVYVVKANQKIYKGDPIDNLEFTSGPVSFKMSTDIDGTNVVITEASFKGTQSDIVVLKHSNFAPITPITGTYTCTECGGSPFLNTGADQTFNMIYTNPDTDGNIVLQSMLGTTAYNGIGFQNNCNANGTETNCVIASGDGVASNVSHTANGQPVFWNGIHTFNNEPTGAGNDCSGAVGTWEWQSNSYGLITGRFISDDGCFQTLFTEDFQTFDGGGFSPTPAVGQLDSDVFIATGFSDGDLAYGGLNIVGDYARGVDDGGVGTGGIYAFETSPTQIAWGVQPGGDDFTPGTFEIKVENTSGSNIDVVRISYDLFINNDQARSNSFNFSYSTDGTTFIPVSTLDYTSPEAADANGFVSIAQSTSQAASIAAGGFIYLRFTGNDVGGSVSRDEFAIDNVLVEGY